MKDAYIILCELLKYLHHLFDYSTSDDLIFKKYLCFSLLKVPIHPKFQMTHDELSIVFNQPVMNVYMVFISPFEK